ncbi:MAG: helix-turn-helix transcriptional regulator [Gemmatimonadetes bacterium]|nr:helix-turn-helix transcriptional regulator [Gemmatimonadota bacterium]
MTLHTYRERPVDGAASDALACIWEHRGSTHASGHLVIPDNCADILLDLAPDGQVLSAAVVGVMTAPVRVPARPGHLVGLRFRPGWLAPLLGVDARELRDARVPLEQVAPRWAGVAYGGPAAVTDLVAAVKRGVAAHRGPAPLVRRVIDALVTGPHDVPVHTLCRSHGVSRQYLARAFSHAVGTGPKFVGRVARLERVRQSLTSRRGDWARLAAEVGLSDQSHLVREMRALTGTVPSLLASGSTGTAGEA